MIELTVQPDGQEPFDVTATARDVYLWERAFKGRSFSQFRDEISMTALYEIGHVACRRQGLFTGSFEEFTTTCDLAFNGETEEVDPTPPAPSADDSSNSPS